MFGSSAPATLTAFAWVARIRADPGVAHLQKSEKNKIHGSVIMSAHACVYHNGHGQKQSCVGVTTTFGVLKHVVVKVYFPGGCTCLLSIASLTPSTRPGTFNQAPTFRTTCSSTVSRHALEG